MIRMTVLTLTKPPCLQNHKNHSFKRSKNQWNNALWPLLLHMRAKQSFLYICAVLESVISSHYNLCADLTIININLHQLILRCTLICIITSL